MRDFLFSSSPYMGVNIALFPDGPKVSSRKVFFYLQEQEYHQILII